MRTLVFLLFSAAVFSTGCANNRQILVSTGTVIGVELAQNQQTGLYQAKLGYNRAEVAVVPTTNGYTPDVITELKYSGIFSQSSDSGIYQRMAVGSIAVSQPGVMAMFLKDGSGNVSSNAVTAMQSLASVPVINTGVTASLVKIAEAYKLAPDKSPWDSVAKANGYVSFAYFLIDTSLTPEKVAIVISGLRSANLIP